MKASVELTFLRGYKDAIMHFNRIDRNLAYFIRMATEHAGEEADLLRILSYSFDKKLTKVRSIMREHHLFAEFAEFFDLAESCRRLRNRLVHGEWRLLERSREVVRYSVPAPLEENGALTIEQFQEQVQMIARANSLFFRLKEKHPLPRAL